MDPPASVDKSDSVAGQACGSSASSTQQALLAWSNPWQPGPELGKV